MYDRTYTPIDFISEHQAMIIKQNLLISITYYAVIMFILVCIVLYILNIFYSDSEVISDKTSHPSTKSIFNQFKTIYFYVIAFFFVALLIIIFMNLQYMYINYIPVPLKK